VLRDGTRDTVCDSRLSPDSFWGALFDGLASFLLCLGDSTWLCDVSIGRAVGTSNYGMWDGFGRDSGFFRGLVVIRAGVGCHTLECETMLMISQGSELPARVFVSSSVVVCSVSGAIISPCASWCGSSERREK